MLRLIGRDVALQRLTFGPRFIRLSTSSQPPLSPTSAHNEPPPLTAQRKSKLELRPGPIKHTQKTTSVTSTVIPSPKPQQLAPTPPPQSAPKGVKETIQSDIQHAEDMGILKPTPPNANGIQRILHKTLEMTKFYFRGAKAIYIRRGTIAEIKARIEAGGLPMQRWENRLIQAQRQDVNKIIPFIFIAILLEELIPVLALYAPFMLPSTCLLPAQHHRIEAKKTAKSVSAASLNRTVFSQLKSNVTPDGLLPIKFLYEGGVSTVICSLLRLPTFGFDYLRIFRIKRHLTFIAKDDQLLTSGNHLATLTESELDQALQERGFIIEGLSPRDKVSKLKWWLESVTSTAPEHMISQRLSLIIQRSE